LTKLSSQEGGAFFGTQCTCSSWLCYNLHMFPQNHSEVLATPLSYTHINKLT